MEQGLLSWGFYCRVFIIWIIQGRLFIRTVGSFIYFFISAKAESGKKFIFNLK